MVVSIHCICCCLGAGITFAFLHRDKPTLLSVLVFSVFSAIDIGFNEIYSVWAKTSPHLGILTLYSMAQLTSAWVSFGL